MWCQHPLQPVPVSFQVARLWAAHLHRVATWWPSESVLHQMGLEELQSYNCIHSEWFQGKSHRCLSTGFACAISNKNRHSSSCFCYTNNQNTSSPPICHVTPSAPQWPQNSTHVQGKKHQHAIHAWFCSFLWVFQIQDNLQKEKHGWKRTQVTKYDF